MITRARWRGPLPEVGDFLRSARTLYEIRGMRNATPPDADGTRRVTLEIERVQAGPWTREGEAPTATILGMRVHAFRWDPRGKRSRA